MNLHYIVDRYIMLLKPSYDGLRYYSLCPGDPKKSLFVVNRTYRKMGYGLIKL